jgi:hypothetical protein
MEAKGKEKVLSSPAVQTGEQLSSPTVVVKRNYFQSTYIFRHVTAELVAKLCCKVTEIWSKLSAL